MPVYKEVECGSDYFLVESNNNKKNQNVEEEMKYKTYLFKESSKKLLYQTRLEAALDLDTLECPRATLPIYNKQPKKLSKRNLGGDRSKKTI